MFCKFFWPAVIIALFSFTFSCMDPEYYTLPAFSGEFVNVVVEIPAGENLKWEYNPLSNKFEVETIDGKERRVQFLPYPGNYGFIPSTHMDKERGGDGDALDVLILSQRLESKSVVETIPIGVIKLLDRGEADDKILAIPRDTTLRLSTCTSLACFRENHPGMIEIVELWFQNYKGKGMMEFKGTLGSKEALEDILKWRTDRDAD